MEASSVDATADSPLAWVTFELDTGVQPALRLRLWPGGESHLLALADPHCRRIDWKA
jgi:hypothetical protein